jgi:serine/threonine protein kinase/tetratricopeptide (TPR) repeat protein
MTEETLFHEARQKPASERTAFLDEACGGDLALRRRIEILLQADDNPDSLLELKPAATSTMSSLSEAPGQVIGPYKLLEQIGEGGMGVVFMAEQHEPVRRRVALKLIKPGMDTRQFIARFEAERQALAVMDHPGIARVLDAGATDSGRPYFVMELVRGVPITTYCDENNLPVRERLELFASVCQAIQHAHTKGIIHRDIKPNNVLVTRQDGRPVVKVIDFGVAKAIGQQLTEKTLFTNFAQMIGTPLYMSPEQAEQSGVDIDTRSDIFSLGVLLYELLTGSTPVNEEQMKKAAFDEIRRIIREDEPQIPSLRISGSNTLPAIAAHRHIEPAGLSRLVRGELDWIVMKALEKDRDRRYETANAFVADLQHYLNDEPVRACPPSATYRFSKFARRNRVGILTAALVALALVLGTIASTWQAIRAERARTAEAEQRSVAEAARSAEATQRQIAEEHRKLAEAERSEAEKHRAAAEANYRKAKAAVDKYFTLVSESKLFEVPGLQPLRKDLLESALEFYEGAALERASDPTVLIDVAATHLRVSSIYLALDRADDFVAAIRRALDVIDRLRREHPDAGDHERKLAGFWKGRRWTQVGMDPPRDLLGALQTGFRFEKTWQQLAEKYPSDVAFQSDLSHMQATIGHGFTLSGRLKEGTAYFRKALAAAEKVVNEAPNEPQYRSELAAAMQLLVGNLIKAGDDPDEALKLTRRAVQLRTALVVEFPNNPAYRSELADCLGALGKQTAKDEPQVAQESLRRAVELNESLIREFPDHQPYMHSWRMALIHLASLNRVMSDASQEAKIQEVADAFLAQINMRPKDRHLREELAHYYIQAASEQAGFTDLADRLHRRAAALTEALVVEFPDDRSVERAVLFHRYAAGDLWGSGQTDEAAKHYKFAVAILEKRAREYPAQPVNARLFGLVAIHLARIMAYGAQTTDVQETCRLCLRATELLDGPLKEDPIRRAFLAVAVRAYGERLLKEPERLSEAAQMIRWSTPIVEQTIKDVALLDKLTADHLAPLEDRHLAAETQRWLAKILTWTNRAAQAEEMWLRAICSYKAIAKDHANQQNMMQYVIGDYSQDLGVRVKQLVKAGQSDEAHAILQRVIMSCEATLAEQPKDRPARQKLAWTLGEAANMWQGPADRDLREQFLRRALALHTELANEPPGDPGHLEQTGHVFRYLGWLERDKGRLDEARQNFEKAVEVFKKLAPDAIPQRDGFYRDFEADTHLQLASVLVAGGKHEAAEKAARQAADIYETLAGQFPDHPDYPEEAADSQRTLADRLEADGRHEESEEIFRRLITTYEKLAADFPANREYRAGITRSYANVIEVLLAQNKHAEAEATIRQAIDGFDELAAAHPAEPDYHRSRAAFQRQLAQRQATDNRVPDADKSYLEAIASYQKIIAEFPKYDDLWRVYDGLAQALSASNRPLEADEARRKMVELAPNNAGTLNNLAWSFATFADASARNATLAVELAKKGIELDPQNEQLSNTLGVAYYRAGKWQDAIEWLEKSMKIRISGNVGDPSNRGFDQLLKLRHGGDSFDWFFLAMAHWQLDHKDEARKWHAKAVEWMDANKPHDQELLRFRAEADELIKNETISPDQDQGVKPEAKPSP